MAFAGFLRQSTAVEVLIGPFVDNVDGDSEEAGLTITQGDVILSKNGQTTDQKNDVTTCATEGDGFYNCELDATDTNTVGQLTLLVHMAGALMVRHDYQVVEEAVFDALYAASATGLLPANVTQLDGGTAAAANLRRSAEAIYYGTVGTGPTTTTLVDAGLTQADDDHWNGRILIFLTGSLAKQATDITGFDAAADELTFTALTSAPAVSDTFVIV